MSSRRRIDLSQPAVAALQRHFKRLDLDEIAGPLLFPSTSGTLVNSRNLVLRSFEPAIERANVQLEKDGSSLRVPKIRFHDLRHTCATILLVRNVHVKVVSEMLGHASVKITLDLYSHLIPTMQSHAAAAFDGVFQSIGGIVAAET